MLGIDSNTTYGVWCYLQPAPGLDHSIADCLVAQPYEAQLLRHHSIILGYSFMHILSGSISPHVSLTEAIAAEKEDLSLAFLNTFMDVASH